MAPLSLPLAVLCAGPAGDYPNANLSIAAAPFGNSHNTFTALRLQGETAQRQEREFLVELGLRSLAQSAPATPQRDKVTLYASVVGESGSGDVWAINPLVRQEAGSGPYTAQGIELDIDNFNEHRGDVSGSGGLAQPNTYGLSVTGAGDKRSTAAIAVFGAEKMWNRGVVGCASNAVAQAVFADYCSAEVSLDIAGSPTWGVRQWNSTATKNEFHGATGVGGAPESGFALRVSGDRGMLHDGLWLEEEHADGSGGIAKAGTLSVSALLRRKSGGDRSGDGYGGGGRDSVALAAVAKLVTTTRSVPLREEALARPSTKSYTRFGVNAESALAALPQLTRVREDGAGHAISSDGLVALLIEAVKEQGVLINRLEARIAALED